MTSAKAVLLSAILKSAGRLHQIIAAVARLKLAIACEQQLSLGRSRPIQVRSSSDKRAPLINK